MEPYTHRPLANPNHIRIMILKPARNRTAPLLCSLVHQELGGKPFEALSYVWGFAEHPQVLLCDKRSISITSNLDRAVRDLRQRFRSRRLWIDAVCINQNDADEKSVQIQLMGQIYKKATHCVIWMEPTNRPSRRVFWSIRCLYHICRRFETSERRVRTEKLVIWLYRSLAKHVFCIRQAGPDLVNEIMVNEWFLRVWTLQEVLLNHSPVIAYGPRTIGWIAMHLARDNMPGLYKWSDDAFDHAFRFLLWSIFERGRKLASLPARELASYESMWMSILWGLKSLKATKPADQVIGAKALLDELLGTNLELGYSEGLPQLYGRVTRALLMATQQFRILVLAATQEQRDGVPSWAVRWGDWTLRDVYMRWSSYSIALQESEGSWIPEHSDEKDDLGLHLQGRTIATIVKHTVPVDPRDQAILLAYHHKGHQASASEAMQAWHQFYHEAFELGVEHVQNQEQYLTEGFDIFGDQSKLSSLSWTEEDKEEVAQRETLFLMDNNHLGRCFCATKIQEGDIVFLPAGRAFPIVLRLEEGSEGCFRYLGPAIIYGIERVSKEVAESMVVTLA